MHTQHASTEPVKTVGHRRWLIRLGMLAAATLFGLLLADRLVGALASTRERHLLRLPAKVSYRHRSNEFDYPFETNSKGLRGPELPTARPPDTMRVAILGDSFVAGLGVADDQLLSTELQRLLNKDAPPSTLHVQVINLGRTGSSTIRELDVYRAVGRPYRPEVVVLAYFLGNDLREILEEQDAQEAQQWHPEGAARRIAYGLFPHLYLEAALWKLNREARHRAGPRTQADILDEIARLASRRGADPEGAVARYRALPKQVRRDFEQGLLPDHLVLPACYDPLRLQTAMFPDDEYLKRAWPRNQQHLDLLREAVTADGGTLVLALIPDAVQVDQAAYDFAQSLGYHVAPQWRRDECRTAHLLKAWAAQAGVPCLDMTDALRTSPSPCYYTQDRHFNPAGHAKAAELLAVFLGQHGLIRVQAK